MMDAMRKLKRGELTRDELSAVLDHPDYLVEFLRYGQPDLPVCGITKSEYMEYLLNALTLTTDEIQNARLRMKHEDVLAFIQHIDEMDDSYLRLFELTDADIDRIQHNLETGLTQECLDRLGDVTILLTISIGNSMGWPYENYIHFDVMQMNEMVKDKETLISLISHEIHHIALSEFYAALETGLTPLEEFLESFAYEGLAVKFNNNAQGLVSNALYPQETVNIGLDVHSWAQHTWEFPFMLERFQQDIHKIMQEELTRDQVQQLLRAFWTRPDIVSLVDGKETMVAQYRFYFMGNELFGAIYDYFGKERLFEVLCHLDETIETYNQAARQKGLSQYVIPIA